MESAFLLPRRTIKVEERLDSWAGIEPLIDNSFGMEPFLGSMDNSISKVYLCRDDKYLYWRVDFVGANPLRRPPSIVVNKMYLQVLFRFERQKRLMLGVNYYPSEGSLKPFLSVWEDVLQTSTTLSSTSLKTDNGKTSFIGSVALNDASGYLTGPLETQVSMGTILKDSRRAEQKTPIVFVEYGK